MLGTQTYTQAELLTILNTAVKGDASLILAHQLIAAKLNVANGASSSISATIAQGDALLAQLPGRLPYRIDPTSPLGQQMVAAAITLDNYNNSCERGATLDSDSDGYSNAVESDIGTNPASYCPIMRADVTGDGRVNIADLLAIVRDYSWTVPRANPRLDQDGDGRINLHDLVLVLASYQQPVTACK